MHPIILPPRALAGVHHPHCSSASPAWCVSSIGLWHLQGLIRQAKKSGLSTSGVRGKHNVPLGHTVPIIGISVCKKAGLRRLTTGFQQCFPWSSHTLCMTSETTYFHFKIHVVVTSWWDWVAAVKYDTKLLILCMAQCIIIITLVLLCLWFRRPRRGFQNWARWMPGTGWEAGNQTRAAPQTVTMKTDVRPQETVQKRPVSDTCHFPPAQTLAWTQIILPLL